MYKYIYWYKRRAPQRYKPVILITGCASGLGQALADLFYEQNKYRVVITARERSLHHLNSRYSESDRFLIRELDVTNEESRQRLVSEVVATWGCIDILVNNAGISYRSVVEHMTDADELKQMNTNYFGPMALTRLVLPSMRNKGRGKIINISSVSGMLAMPTMASYSASKYALEGASEALWYEMRPFGIDVSLVQPGIIHSNSFKNVYSTANAWDEAHSEGPYSEYYKNMTPFVERLMGLSRSSPQSIAKLVLYVVQTVQPPLWVPATFDAEFFYYLRRIFPRRILHPLLFSCLPGAKKWGEKYTRKRPSFFKRIWARYFAKA